MKQAWYATLYMERDITILRQVSISPFHIILNIVSELEVNKFELGLRSPKNRFQLNAGLNLETLNTILSGTNHI